MNEDEVSCIYFLIGGEAGFVLPEYGNQMYIKFNVGCHFGILDIVSFKTENKSND